MLFHALCMQVKIPFKFSWKVHELHKLHLHQLQMLQQALFLHQLLKLRQLQELQELQTAPEVPRAPGAGVAPGPTLATRAPRVHSAIPALRVPGALHDLQQLLYLQQLLKLHRTLENHQHLKLEEHIRVIQLLELFEQSASFSMATNPKFLSFTSRRLNRPRAPRAVYEVHEEQVNGHSYLVKKKE